VRIKVINNRAALAKSCRAYLVNIERNRRRVDSSRPSIARVFSWPGHRRRTSRLRRSICLVMCRTSSILFRRARPCLDLRSQPKWRRCGTRVFFKHPVRTDSPLYCQATGWSQLRFVPQWYGMERGIECGRKTSRLRPGVDDQITNQLHVGSLIQALMGQT